MGCRANIPETSVPLDPSGHEGLGPQLWASLSVPVAWEL